jgi:hypothetical protein
MHVFFGEMTGRFIGWADSPFQTEVGVASPGFAVVGFLAFRGGVLRPPARASELKLLGVLIVVAKGRPEEQRNEGCNGRGI